MSYDVVNFSSFRYYGDMTKKVMFRLIGFIKRRRVLNEIHREWGGG